MPTEKGSSFDELFKDYPKDFPKTVKELGKRLVPPMEETEFVSLSNELRKLLTARQDERDYAEIAQFQDKNETALMDIRILSELVPKRKSKVHSLLLVSLFLFEFEGLYANTMDSFCLQLVTEGHDLFDPIKREYVSSFGEIGDVDIATKFKFLERHNLKMLVRRGDQRLRNKIAHYDFRVDNEGNFSIDGKVVDIGSKLVNLMTFLVCVDLVISQALKTILRKRQARITMLKNQLKTST
jgi:hypothetical protein